MKTVILFLSFVVMFTACTVSAQNSDNNRAKAYYYVAEDAYENGKHNDSLEAIAKTESLLGKSNAALTALKVKNYFKLGNLIEAKKFTDSFFDYQATDELTKEIYKLLVGIESELSIKNKIENDKIVVANEAEKSRKQTKKLKDESRDQQAAQLKSEHKEATEKLDSFITSINDHNNINLMTPKMIVRNVNNIVALTSRFSGNPRSKINCFSQFDLIRPCKNSSQTLVSWSDAFKHEFSLLTEQGVINSNLFTEVVSTLSKLENRKNTLFSEQLDKIQVMNKIIAEPREIKYLSRQFKRKVSWEDVNIKDMQVTFRGSYSHRERRDGRKYLNQTTADIYDLSICELMDNSEVNINLVDTGNKQELEKYQLHLAFKHSPRGINSLKQRVRKESGFGWKKVDWKPGTQLFLPVRRDIGDELLSIFELNIRDRDDLVAIYYLNDLIQGVCLTYGK